MIGNNPSIIVPAFCPCGVRRHVAAFPLRDMSRSSPATFGSALHAPSFSFQLFSLSVDQRPSAVKNVASVLWAEVAPWIPARLTVAAFSHFHHFSNGRPKSAKSGQKRPSGSPLSATSPSCSAGKVAAGRMRCGALTSSTAPKGEVSSALRSQLLQGRAGSGAEIHWSGALTSTQNGTTFGVRSNQGAFL